MSVILVGSTWQNLGSSSLTVQNVGQPGDVIDVVVSDVEPASDERGFSLDQIRSAYRITPEVGESVYVRYRRLDSTVVGARTGQLYVVAIELSRVQPVDAVPWSIFDGNKAITTQPFTEVNSKKGTQYETSFYNPSLAGGQSTYLIMVIGEEPVLIKELQLQFNVDLISTSAFRGPTYTGGTELQVYNLNDINPVADDVTILAGSSVTDEGVQIAPTIHSIGGDGNFFRRVSSVGQQIGVVQVLRSNTTYAFKITNLNGIDARIVGLATWYQGRLSNDTPI